MNATLNPSVQRAISRVVLRSELWRAALVLGVLAFLLGFVLLLQAAPESGPLYRARLARGVIVLVLGLLYESGVLVTLLRWRRADRPSPAWFRWLNTTVEVSLPTVAVLLLAPVTGLAPALAGAAPYVYFVLIVFTALYLDFGLCVVAGFLAGGQFAVLAAVALRDLAPVEGWEVLNSPGAYWVKASTLLLTGLAAGFVARQIRGQMVAAVRSASERDRAISMFGQHVSPQVADLLLRQPLEFTGEEREVCVMFLDIRDFSKLAAAQAPGDVMRYLNTLFSTLINIVNRHQGIVNKFLGDGFMAVFGAPVNDASLCEHAVTAAREILDAVGQLNAGGEISATRLGIGLHVGGAVTGNVGSDERKEYTIIGDVVNLAARIEQATKQFGAQLLISDAVQQRLPAGRFEARDLGPVDLKGQPLPTRLFQLA